MTQGQRERFPGGGNSTCKDPEAFSNPLCFKESPVISNGGLEVCGEGREVRVEVGRRETRGRA